MHLDFALPHLVEQGLCKGLCDLLIDECNQNVVVKLQVKNGRTQKGIFRGANFQAGKFGGEISLHQSSKLHIEVRPVSLEWIWQQNIASDSNCPAIFAKKDECRCEVFHMASGHQSLASGSGALICSLDDLGCIGQSPAEQFVGNVERRCIWNGLKSGG